MDSFKALYEKISKYKEQANVFFDKNLAKKNMTLYVRELITKFDASGDQKPFIAAKVPCYVKVNAAGDQKRIFYVIGAREVIQLNEIEQPVGNPPSLLWLGDACAPDMVVLPRNEESKKKELSYLKKLLHYHKGNFPIFIMLLGHLKVTMRMEDLVVLGDLKVPNIHLIGPMSTGKSELATHFTSVYPLIRLQDGILTREVDNRASCAILPKQLSNLRPPLVQDPPSYEKKITETFDSMYERKLILNHHNNNTLQGQKVKTSIIAVWPHELQQVPHLDGTAISKGVFLPASKDDLLTDMERFKIREEISELKHCVNSLLRPTLDDFDLALLKRDMMRFKGELITEHPDLGRHPRVLDCVTLIMASSMQVFSKFGFTDEELGFNPEDQVLQYILGKACPWVIARLKEEEEKPVLQKSTQELTQEAVIDLACKEIGMISSQKILQEISFGHYQGGPAAHFKKVTFKNTIGKLHCAVGVERKPKFLNPDFHEGPFLTSEKRSEIRKPAICIRMPLLPNKIFVEIKGKLEDILPAGADITPESDIAKIIKHRFDLEQLNDADSDSGAEEQTNKLGQNAPHRSEIDQALKLQMGKLDLNMKKELLGIINEMLAKFRPESNQNPDDSANLSQNIELSESLTLSEEGVASNQNVTLPQDRPDPGPEYFTSRPAGTGSPTLAPISGSGQEDCPLSILAMVAVTQSADPKPMDAPRGSQKRKQSIPSHPENSKITKSGY